MYKPYQTIKRVVVLVFNRFYHGNKSLNGKPTKQFLKLLSQIEAGDGILGSALLMG